MELALIQDSGGETVLALADSRGSAQFPQVSQKALYPTDKDDPLCKLAGDIIRAIPPPIAA